MPLGAIVIFGLAFTALITLTFLPALLGLWRSKFYEHAAFYGGTALRIFHGLRRFSEDLDFSLLEPDADFDLAPHLEAIRCELAGFGFTFEVEQKIKQIETPIESAFIKGSTSLNLLEIGVPPGLPERFSTTQKLKIKLEVDTDPPAGADTRRVTLSARCGRTCAVERGLLCGAAEPDEGERGVRCFAFCFDADKSVCIAGRVNAAASSRSYSLCGHQLWRFFR